MPVYNYKVLDTDSNVLKGTMVASDLDEAQSKLNAQGYKILEIHEASTTSTRSTEGKRAEETFTSKAKKIKTSLLIGSMTASVENDRIKKSTLTEDFSKFASSPPEKGYAKRTSKAGSFQSIKGKKIRRSIEEKKHELADKSSSQMISKNPTPSSDAAGFSRGALKPGKSRVTRIIKVHRDYFTRFRITIYDLLICTRQFQQMVSVGLPIVKAMNTLWENQSNEALKKVLKEINMDLQRGMSLTAAFSLFPDVFSPIYLAMIRVGEATGNLDEALRNIASLLEREHEMRAKIAASLTYPSFIFAVASVLVVFIIFYFVPVFINVFDQLHLVLPLPTKILLLVVKIFRRWDVILLSIFSLIICGILFFLNAKRSAFRQLLDEIKISIPLLGDAIILIALGRVLNNMAMMLQAGVPLLTTLTITISSTTIIPLQKALQELEKHMKEGYNMSSASLDPRFFTVLFKSFVAAGEESGSLPFMLESLAKIYNENINARLDTLINLMEPVLLTIVSIVIGFILIAIFLPLYGVLNSLG